MLVFMQIILGTLLFAVGLAALRLVRGPTLVNRVVALDVLAILAAVIAALLSIVYDQRVLLDVTVVLTLVSFLTTVAFAYYVERKHGD